jgi:hypothetical protein
LQVLVRPLIDFLQPNYISAPGQQNPLNGTYTNGEFRNNYDPGAAGSAGANSFFASYQAVMVQEAKVAQANHAQIFDIGTEIDQLTGPAYASYWNSLITAVKAVYSGKLTYSANWDSNQGYWKYNNNLFTSDNQLGSSYITGNLATQVSFWSQLDYVGVDEYAAISDASNPDSLTVAQLEAGWTQTPTDPVVKAVTGGQSLIQYYEGLAAATGKPLLFTELGYGDVSDAAADPPVPGYTQQGALDGAVADPALQAKLYQAFFAAWAASGNAALNGVFFWEYEPNGATIVQAGTPLYNASGQETYNPYPTQGQAGAAAIAAGFALCFCPGTRMATPGGEMLVEALRVGDWVHTLAGAQRILWIGRRSYEGRFCTRNHLVLPVHIKAGALGAGVPARELVVSPGHGIWCGAALVPAWRLVNGVSITQPTPPARIDYLHLELESHELLLAEGCPVESYFECGHRAMFQNAHDYAGGARDVVALPRLEEGFELEAIQRRVRARAGLGEIPKSLGALRGFVEHAGGGVCAGWAADGPAAVWLDVFAGARWLGRVIANGYRADLRAAGIGDGCHGFAFAVPADVGDVTVRRAGDGAVLEAWQQAACA